MSGCEAISDVVGQVAEEKDNAAVLDNFEVEDTDEDDEFDKDQDASKDMTMGM